MDEKEDSKKLRIEDMPIKEHRIEMKAKKEQKN